MPFIDIWHAIRVIQQLIWSIIHAFFITMVKSFENKLKNAVPVINIKDYILDNYVPAKVPEPLFEIVYLAKECETLTAVNAQLNCPELMFPFARAGQHAYEASINSAMVLVEASEETHLKRVLELTIDTSSAAEFDYQPGDTIGILPSNSLSEVNLLLHVLNIFEKANSAFQLQLLANSSNKSTKLPTHIPTVTTPFVLLRDCLNLRAVPKKQFLSALAISCKTAEDRDFLNCLSSKEGRSHYNKLILERGLTLVDLLLICPSCHPKLQLLIEHLPRLLPRPYSIANSPDVHAANQIKIIFSLLVSQPGVTTKMLNDLAESLLNKTTRTETKPKIAIYLRNPNTFRYTIEDARESKQILIGIGTALAPYFGFLEHKQALLSSGRDKSLGATWLIAGATTASSLLHRDHLLALHANGVLERYFECFSRKYKHGDSRYVQEILEANAAEIVALLLQPETVLYVCADGGEISNSIESCIAHCLRRQQKLTEEEAKSLLRDFRAKGKYREDLWV